MPSISASTFGRSFNRSPSELLSPAQSERLARCSKLVRIRKGAIIFGEGQVSHSIFNLVQGMVETYHVRGNGQRRVTAFMFPNDLFGLSENGRYCMTAQAVTAVVAYRIPLVQLTQLMHNDPSLQLHLLCMACHEIRESQQHVLQIGHNEARARIAAFLLMLARRNHEVSHAEESLPAKFQVDLPMSRSDIADYSALTVESVSRALHALEELQLIRRVSAQRIVILDKEGLCREAGDF